MRVSWDKGLSVRYLKYMAKFARESGEKLVQTLFAQLSWSHTIALMDKVPSLEERVWYGQETLEGGWSLSTPRNQIESGLYTRQRLAHKVNNIYSYPRNRGNYTISRWLSSFSMPRETRDSKSPLCQETRRQSMPFRAGCSPLRACANGGRAFLLLCMMLCMTTM